MTPFGIRSMGQLLRRRHATAGCDADSGFSLAEVLVSMFVFALVSVGVLHSLLSVISVNRDSRARQVEANLAAAEIDRAREVQDLFTLLDATSDVQVGTDMYRVDRQAAWVSDPSAEFDCGTGGSGGALRYKRVNVTVTWDGMRPSTEPVRSDTVIDPKERINDPTKGTLLISVLNASGTGTAGVTVTAQAVDGAGSPVGSPLPAATTDAQGCAYVLKVAPANYKISISKSNHVNTAGEATPSTVVGVAAGSSGSAAFEYDEAAEVTVRYATNSPSLPVSIPTTTMNTTLANTAGYFAKPGTVVTAGDGSTYPTRRFTVYPFSSGYDLFAGTGSNSEVAANTCNSVDPALWPGGAREAQAAVEPGGTASVDVPMGVVGINVPNISSSSQRYVKAVLVAPPAGVDDPGCQTGLTVYFGQVLNSSGDGRIALPYGTWSLTRGSLPEPGTTISAGELLPVVDAHANGSLTGVVLGDLVVSDPRITP